MKRQLTLLTCGFSILVGCSKEAPPVSVTELVDNPILLEATMVRCSQDRSRTRYDAECVNARAAVDRIQAKEEAAAKAALEARSESKRKALRRTQEAAAEARRRAAEEQRQREEAEYLAQFGVSPDEEGETASDPPEPGNIPVAEVPAPIEATGPGPASGDAPPATDGGNAPVSLTEPEPTESDIDSIREELRRRGEEGSN